MDTFNKYYKHRMKKIGRAGLSLLTGILYLFFLTGDAHGVDSPISSAEFQQVQQDDELSDLYVFRNQDEIPTVSINAENMLLIDLLHQLADELEVDISINTQKIRNKSISYRAENKNIYDVLNELLENTGLEVVLSQDRKVLIIQEAEERINPELFQETITGSVTDAQNGEALPGVNIIVKNTTTGTSTDVDGEFDLTVPSLTDTLVFSFIGYQTQEIPLDGNTTIDVQMVLQAISGEELVVIGYGSVQRSDLTGSVASVQSDDINAFPSTNVLQALTGRTPGVEVLQNTGAPGAGISIRIRGTNSIQGGNDPLFVVDGFPVSGNPTNLNNSDIESVEVLKDASATAIYGSRGANGVVLITTKRGNKGGTKVDFESSYGIQTLRKKLDLMNAEEYAQLQNLQATNDNVAPFFNQNEINNLGEGFDWQDFVFEQAPMQTHSLDISSGNETTQFSVGGSMFGQQGIVEGSDYNRYSLRTNLSHTISEKFRVNFSGTLTHLNTKRKDSGGGHRGNSMINAAVTASPISTPYQEDGSYTILSEEFPFVPVDVTNPINYINEQSTEIKANVLLSNASLIYSPLPELDIKISGGIENRDDRTDSYLTRNFLRSDGNASVGTGQTRSLLSENTVSYNNTFGERHQISAVAGFTYQDFVNTNLGAGGSGFLSDVFETHNLGAAQNPGIPNSSYSKSVILSSLARINYTFDDKYLLTTSFRTDGSSRYSEDNKWGYFPSAAIAWRVSEEDFLRNNEVITDLKLRTSWGLTGSQAIGAYATLNQLTSGNTVFGNELYNTFAPGTRLPGDLQWETTQQYDIGVDVELLEGRFFITADYYVKDTYDLLNTVRLPSSMGFTNTIQNVGEVQNKGFEFGINANISTRTDFLWNVSANVSLNRNKVIRLHNGEDILGGFVGVLVLQDNVNILREGRPMGQFYGYIEDGYDEQGQIKYLDLDGDGSITSSDKTFIGDPNPDFVYGFNSSMSYRNFELSFFIQGTYGNDIFNVSSIPSTLDYGQGLNMLREVYSDHWTPDNTDAKYPIISRSSASVNVSDRFVEDGSYLRLKNIKLAYNFSVGNLGLSNAQIYLSGQNLITLTKYSWWDPEVNSRGAGIQRGIDHFTYPVSKVVTAGFRAGF